MADSVKAPRTGLKDRREVIASLLLRLRAMGLPHRLMSAFEAVPRQNFVPVMFLDESYGRGQLPIECGQTMPSADHVARLLMALAVGNTHRVLELGTGSGYQAALLGRLGAKVSGLERYRTLVDKARQRLESLEIDNVRIELADGRNGTPNKIYDRILINFALPQVPDFLDEQLSAGGVAILPVGPGDGQQVMTRVTKNPSGIETTELFPVRMQPPMSGVSKAI